jgi:hypothetical protein
MRARALAAVLLLITLLTPAGVHAQGARRRAAVQNRQQSSSAAALAWPQITRQTKPWARWWWLGSAVNKRDLTTEMEKYEKAGLGGLELTAIYGVHGREDRFIKYLSPAWVEMLEHTLHEADRLGIGIDMAVTTGWPFGGPWVGPEDACKDFVSKTFELKGGERLHEAVRFVQKPLLRTVGTHVNIKDLKQPVSANENLQALALDQVRFETQLPLETLMAYSDRGETLNLTDRVDAAGRLDWVAPAGSWKLYAIFQGWHGKQVERAAPGGEGDVVDHFSADALTHYLSKLDRAFAGHDIRPLRAFFNDSYEVDDAEGQSDWTPKFFDEFRARRGYDLREQLPALLSDDTPERHARVLYDFRETISDLLLERFTDTWRRWAATKGAIIRNQPHGSPANILDLYAASDIPETEGLDVVRMKFASSAADVTGKPLASAEAVTWLDEHFLSTLGDVKRAVDLDFLGGINHVVYHGLAFSPEDEPWPGRLFYAAVHFGPQNPDWKNFPALNAYIARTQSFLQWGRPDNDVLLYYPIHDMWSEPGKERLVHVGGGFDIGITQGDARAMLDAGYAFDFISDRQLAGTTFDGDLLRTAARSTRAASGGGSYKVIVLPESRFIPVATFDKLVRLARQGATVVVRNELPADVPGFANLDARRARLKQLVDQLHFDGTGEAGIASAKVGEGRFLLGGDLSRLLSYANVRREALVGQGLHFTRRVYAGGSLYFINNRSDKSVDGWVPLETGARAAVIFDPMRGDAGLAALRAAGVGGASEVYLQLPPGESLIVKTSDGAVRGPSYPYFKTAGEPQTLGGTWSVRFVEGGPELPPERETRELNSWTEFEGDAYKTFSGTARYTINFKRPQGAGREWLLDLGRVEESARVRLNGKELGTLIMSPFSVRVPGALLKEMNTLEVEVSNLPANRIIDLDRRGVKWKRFYNTNFPARRPENRGPDGLFDASHWSPKDSGLLGPVTLTPIEAARL